MELSKTEIRRRSQRLECTRVHPELDAQHEGGHPPFTCPKCQRTSMHPQDLRQGYCANCRDFTGIGMLLELGLPRIAPAGSLRPLPPPG